MTQALELKELACLNRLIELLITREKKLTKNLHGID